ncbi:YppG family protein [Ornithinibacillus sp. 179-J 7C1 HS]|uniref:YppG family protein n=1 Tax=Ornithinibacillus sp. 179-J 7C1 HS TaxID=3142384 RepID=UPI0039A0E9E5
MRQFGYPPYYQQGNQPNYYNQQAQQPFHPSPYQQYYQNVYEQPKSAFEQFAKPKQPQDWYDQMQGSNQQAQPQQEAMAQFQNQGGQMNLDKVLTTVSQIANTYHQVSPIIKQFGAFMKTFR